MRKCLFPCLVTILLSASCKKPLAEQGRATATAKYIDAFTWVQNGTMPLVISVPHGGTLAPDSIADRTCPNITTAVDTYTVELVKAIDSVAKQDYQFQPFIVLTQLRRIKLDQNRDLPEATCSTPFKYMYWSNFHNAIDSSINTVLAKYPSCLYIDLHGHGHPIQRLELGYLISKAQLQNISSVTIGNTSVRALAVQNGGQTLANLITGSNSFGSIMQAKGFPTVPSAAMPFPAVADDYFDGGYNTARYTNRANVFGFQIESNYTGVRATAAQRAQFAKAFMQSVVQYCTANTNLSPSTFGE